MSPTAHELYAHLQDGLSDRGIETDPYSLLDRDEQRAWEHLAECVQKMSAQSAVAGRSELPAYDCPDHH